MNNKFNDTAIQRMQRKVRLHEERIAKLQAELITSGNVICILEKQLKVAKAESKTFFITSLMFLVAMVVMGLLASYKW